MLCAHCGERLDDDTTRQHRDHATLLDGRYALLDILAQGASTTTYRASRLDDGTEVVIKELLVSRLASFKTEELHLRAAKVLAGLDHPAVARFEERFSYGQGKSLGLYLVTRFVPGRTLADEMVERSHSQAEVLEIMAELCAVLADLHTREPALIHRDIKPSNVVRRSNDGRLILIDFGAVREQIAGASSEQSTVAGTYGYMAPEQYLGRAGPASDIYAVAVLGLSLLTRRAPHELCDAQHRLDWQRIPGLPRPLRTLFKRMLEPDPASRPADAGRLSRQIRVLAWRSTADRHLVRQGGMSPLRRAARAFAALAALFGAVALAAIAWGRLSFSEPQAQIADVIAPPPASASSEPSRVVSTQGSGDQALPGASGASLGAGLAGFALTRRCPIPRDLGEGERVLSQSFDDQAIAGLPARCTVRSFDGDPCALHCTVGFERGILQAEAMDDLTFAERKAALLGHFRAQYGAERTHLEQDMGPVAVELWDWAGEGHHLRLRGEEHKEVDEKTLAWFPGARFKIAVDYSRQ